MRYAQLCSPRGSTNWHMRSGTPELSIQDMTKPTLPSLVSDIRLYGKVDEDMLTEFFRQQAQAKADKHLVIELGTNGGDADVGRRIAQELTLWQKSQREHCFFGKTYVYSAGVTIMSAIPPQRRFLTKDCF